MARYCQLSLSFGIQFSLLKCSKACSTFYVSLLRLGFSLLITSREHLFAPLPGKFFRGLARQNIYRASIANNNTNSDVLLFTPQGSACKLDGILDLPYLYRIQIPSSLQAGTEYEFEILPLSAKIYSTLKMPLNCSGRIVRVLRSVCRTPKQLYSTVSTMLNVRV
jgi:hypothetical protein